MNRKLGLVMLFAAALLHGAGGALRNPAQAVLWSGVVSRGMGPVGEVAECAPGCERFDLDIGLPGGVWSNKPGGVQIAIRWGGGTFGDNLRLFVYRNNTLIAKSDGIIAISQGVLIPEPADGNLRVYVAYDPDSTTNPLRYEALAEVEYQPNPRPIRALLPDLTPRPQTNLGFDPEGIFFDVISPAFPTCYETEVQEEGAHLCLRFDQTFANTGEGPMELRFSVPAGTTPPFADVFQRVYWSDSPNHFEDRLAGQVTFHVAHGHYHFTSFGLSRLWAADAAGLRKNGHPVRERRLKRTMPLSLVSAGRKVSFCLADTLIDAWAKKGDGPRTYIAPDCLFPAFTNGGYDHFVQGITAGWADIYDFYLPDQFIEVSGVPDGDYILENRGDPDGRLLEANEDNNCTSIRIRLRGMTSNLPSVLALGPGPSCSPL
jgi:hypothetical protein